MPLLAGPARHLATPGPSPCLPLAAPDPRARSRASQDSSSAVSASARALGSAAASSITVATGSPDSPAVPVIAAMAPSRTAAVSSGSGSARMTCRSVTPRLATRTCAAAWSDGTTSRPLSAARALAGAGLRRRRISGADRAVHERVEPGILEPEGHMGVPSRADVLDRVPRVLHRALLSEIQVEPVLDDRVDQALLRAEEVIERWHLHADGIAHGPQ